jgi:zinc protease
MKTNLALSFLCALTCACSSNKEKKPQEEPAPDKKAEEKKTEKPAEEEVVIESKTVPSDADAPFELDSKVVKGVLDNGLTYYIRRNTTPEKRAEFWISIDAGSFQEDENQRGLAHFVEHMAFNGTEAFPKNELIGKLQSLGVEFGPHLNAHTAFDETVYKLRLPTDDKESIDLGLHILSQWAGAISFRPEDVDAERGVVLSEKRSRDGAEMRLMQGVIEEVFAGTRYAERLPIGLPKVLETASVDTLRKYYQDWYHPANMAVYVVGDIDPSEMETKVKEKFSALKAQEKPRAAPKRKMPAAGKMKFLSLQDKELPIQAVALGRLQEAKPTGTLNEFRVSYIEAMATIMLTKRLEEARQRGSARFMMGGAGAAPLVRNSRVVAILAMVSPDKILGGFQDLVLEIERVRRHGFTQAEYERASKEMITMIRSSAKEDAAGKEKSGKLVAELTRHHLSGEGMPGRAMELAIMEHFAKTVSVKEIGTYFEGFLEPKGLIAANLGSAGGALNEKLVLKEVAKLQSMEVAPYTEEESDQNLLESAPTPGKVTKEVQHAEAGVSEWTLSNGARVILKPTSFKEDEILFQASSHGGMNNRPTKKLASVRRTVSAVERGGVGRFDAVALEKALAGKNVSLETHISRHSEGMRGKSGVDDIETLLQLVHLRFTEPRKDPAAFEIFKNEVVEQARQSTKKPEVRFARKRKVFFANDNPRVSAFDEKAAKALDLDESFAFYRDRMSHAGDFTFYFVGNFEPATLKPLVETYLASLPDEGRREKAKTLHWKAPKTQRILQKKDGSEDRASLSLLFEQDVKLEQVDPEAMYAWQVVGRAIKMRFLELFREEMGATYGVQVTTDWDHNWTQAELSLALQCDPKRVKELQAAALKELETLRSEGISEDHFAKAKETQLKQVETSLQRNDYWLGSLLYVYFNDKPLSFILDMKKTNEALTLEDVRAAHKEFAAQGRAGIAIHLPK